MRTSLTGKREPFIDGFSVQASSRGATNGFVAGKRQVLAVIPRIACLFACLVSSKVSNAAINIVGNDALANVDGLSGVSQVSTLSIQSNPALLNLDGLVNLESVSGSLTVKNNSSLDNCAGLARVLGWPDGPPDDSVGGTIDISGNGGPAFSPAPPGTGSGCASADEILSSVSAPSQPVITRHSTSQGNLSLFFNESISTNTAFPVTGYQAFCSSSLADFSDSPAAKLLDNVPVTRRLRVDGEASSVSFFDAFIEVSIDITHSDPTDLSVKLTSPEGTALLLWDQNFAGSQNLQGTFPTTLTPVDSLLGVADEALDGQWALTAEDVSVGPIVREGVFNSWGLRITESGAFTAGGSSPVKLQGLGRGRNYSCTVTPVTALGQSAVSEAYIANVPVELPQSPVIVSTDYEDESITLVFSSRDNGGTDITGYEATCTNGTNTFTGTSTSSPITVSGLTNDVAYTCTVTATNSVGTSSASAATDPITPEATATGLPIWLLYQAAQ